MIPYSGSFPIVCAALKDSLKLGCLCGALSLTFAGTINPSPHFWPLALVDANLLSRARAVRTQVYLLRGASVARVFSVVYRRDDRFVTLMVRAARLTCKSRVFPKVILFSSFASVLSWSPGE